MCVCVCARVCARVWVVVLGGFPQINLGATWDDDAVARKESASKAAFPHSIGPSTSAATIMTIVEEACASEKPPPAWQPVAAAAPPPPVHSALGPPNGGPHALGSGVGMSSPTLLPAYRDPESLPPPVFF